MKKQSKSATQIRNWEIKTKKMRKLERIQWPKWKTDENEQTNWKKKFFFLKSTTQMRKQDRVNDPDERRESRRTRNQNPHPKRRVQCEWKLGFFREQRLGFWVMDFRVYKGIWRRVHSKGRIIRKVWLVQVSFIQRELKKKKDINQSSKTLEMQFWTSNFLEY